MRLLGPSCIATTLLIGFVSGNSVQAQLVSSQPFDLSPINNAILVLQTMVNTATTSAQSATATANSANALALTAVQPSALTAAANNNLAIMAATTPQFVGGSSAYQTQAALKAAYPCAASIIGKLGNVSDAYGSLSTTLVCGYDGLAYNWKPYNDGTFAQVVTQASGAYTLNPLSSAPTVYFSTTPTGNMTITPSSTGAWIGETFHVYAPSTIGVSTISINNLVGGGTVPLVQGSDKILTYTSVGWKSN